MNIKQYFESTKIKFAISQDIPDKSDYYYSYLIKPALAVSKYEDNTSKVWAIGFNGKSKKHHSDDWYSTINANTTIIVYDKNRRYLSLFNNKFGWLEGINHQQLLECNLIGISLIETISSLEYKHNIIL